MSAVLEVERYAGALGGDDDFFKGRAFAKYWTPALENLGDFTGWVKGEAAFIGDDVPFFELPYIEMRDLRAMRYQSELGLHPTLKCDRFQRCRPGLQQ